MSNDWGISVSGFTAYWQIPDVPIMDGYIGSRIRGILGHALFAQVCPYPTACCKKCALAPYCDYTRVFKPLSPEALPAYILHDWRVEQGAIAVTVLLLGTASQAAENWIKGLLAQLPQLDWWGQGGMSLLKVTDWQSEAILFVKGRFVESARLTYAQRWPSLAADLNVHFITPLISKHQHDDPLMPALKTRLQRLRNQFGDGGLFCHEQGYWRCRIQNQQSAFLSLGNRQRKLSGNYFSLKLTDIADEGGLLLGAGLWLHAGGQTGLGFGRYRLEVF